MFTNKQIFLVALALSLPAAMVSMEKPSKHKSEKSAEDIDYSKALSSIVKAESYKKSIKKGVKHQARLINEFAQKNAKGSTYNSDDIKILGSWLTEQRKKIRKDKEWNLLIEKMTDEVTLNRLYCAESVITKGTSDLIKEVARSLKPGEDCTEALVNEAGKIVQEALAREY